ncbi:MAG: hypothetical protein MI924_20720 [Chloroflexales bacterium]|nr:hypothetical protein [Chloroflexales bacterium]
MRKARSANQRSERDAVSRWPRASLPVIVVAGQRDDHRVAVSNASGAMVAIGVSPSGVATGMSRVKLWAHDDELGYSFIVEVCSTYPRHA